MSWTRDALSSAARQMAKYQLPFPSNSNLARVPLGKYRHNKTKTEYTVIGHAIRVQEDKAIVLYRNEELAVGQFWERLLDGPNGFCTPNTDGTPRFTQVNIY